MGVVSLADRVTVIDELDQLIDRTSVAREQAAAAVRRSAVLVEAATKVCEQARLGCLRSRPHKLYAHLSGEVDGQPVRAVVRTDGSLLVDGDLRQRADLLVRLGETFDGGRLASLSGPPLTSALTLIRACDRIAEFECALAIQGE